MVTKINSCGLHNTPSLITHIKYEHLIAGVTGGVASTLTLHPLDVIKIRLAVNDGTGGQQIPQYNGLWNAFTTIFRQEGLHGLYRGVTPNIYGAGSSWGLYFLLYNTIKTCVQGGNVNEPLSIMDHLIAASETGVLTLTITNPIWVVKTRLVLQYGKEVPNAPPDHYKGVWDALVKIYKKEGIKGYYRGFVPGLFGVSHGAVQFMVYEELKSRYNKYYDLPISTKMGAVQYIAFAAVSKFIAVGTTYPYQVVRARLQDLNHSYKGAWDCVKRTWTYEGWGGFYKGVTANLLRVTPATMITFLTYEKVSHFLIEYNKSRQSN